MFEEVLYGDQPAGWNIAGPRENIRNMVRDNFVKYKTAHYVASSTVIIVSGSVTPGEVDREVAKYFSHIASTTKSKKVKTNVSQAKPNILVKYKATDQTHLVLGVRTYPLSDKRNPILSVLSGVLGAGMSSRLFNKLREDMGVAYYVRASNDASLDHGSFQVSAGVNNARTVEVIGEILKECARLKTELVGDEELAKVKSFLIGNMKLSLESTDDIASFYGSQELMRGEIKTLDEKIKSINRVTASDIKKIANQIFKDSHLNLALIGPFDSNKLLWGVLKL
jgi:predicted Zn-dependent peptidase